MPAAVVTYKVMNLYVACAPESGAYSFGACLEEAINDLADQVRGPSKEDTGYERKQDAIG